MSAEENDYWSTYPYKLPLSQALVQIQYGLHHLIYDGELDKRGIAIESVELDLVTVREVKADGSFGVWFVTVAGEVNRKSTTTLKVSLPPVGPSTIKAEVDYEDVIGLAKAMFQLIDTAAATYPPLMFGSAEMVFELLASEKGSIEIGKRGIIEKVLEWAGFKASAGASYEQVRTSTATIKFKNPAIAPVP